MRLEPREKLAFRPVCDRLCCCPRSTGFLRSWSDARRGRARSNSGVSRRARGPRLLVAVIKLRNGVEPLKLRRRVARGMRLTVETRRRISEEENGTFYGKCASHLVRRSTFSFVRGQYSKAPAKMCLTTRDCGTVTIVIYLSFRSLNFTSILFTQADCSQEPPFHLIQPVQRCYSKRNMAN